MSPKGHPEDVAVQRLFFESLDLFDQCNGVISSSLIVKLPKNAMPQAANLPTFQPTQRHRGDAYNPTFPNANAMPSLHAMHCSRRYSTDFLSLFTSAPSRRRLPLDPWRTHPFWHWPCTLLRQLLKRLFLIIFHHSPLLEIRDLQIIRSTPMLSHKTPFLSPSCKIHVPN